VFVTHPFFSSGFVGGRRNVTAVGAPALVETTERVPASTPSRVATDSVGVTGLVLSKRSMHDELKKSSGYLIRPGDGNLRRTLLRPLLWVALSIGLCQQSLAQHEALELGPEEAAPTLPPAE
jgi:hypothetical protein